MFSNNKINRSGFTMVELLVTIIILGILMGVSIGAVSWILQDADERYYESLEKTVAAAAESYYADHRGSLPKSIGQNRKILLKTLVEQGYLTDVVDRSKQDCTASENSYVKVTKYSKSNYLYTTYLDCPAYRINDNTLTKEIDISIDFDTSDGVNSSTASVSINAGTDNKIASYQYHILKDGQTVYTSESIAAGYSDSVNRDIDLKSYVPGNIRIVVTVYDIHGNSKTKQKELAIYNASAPECGAFSPKYTEWTNDSNASREVTVQCPSGECSQSSYSQTFTQDAQYGYIQITGSNGKTRNCRVNVYIDKTKPECGSDNGSKVWTNVDREIVLECSDNASGCKQIPYKKKYSSTTTTANITIEDKAGNKQTCPVNVYVDKTKPTCGSSSISSDGKTATVACSDSESGCSKDSFSANIPSGANKVNVTIKDKAGNSRSCSVDTSSVNPPDPEPDPEPTPPDPEPDPEPTPPDPEPNPPEEEGVQNGAACERSGDSVCWFSPMGNTVEKFSAQYANGDFDFDVTIMYTQSGVNWQCYTGSNKGFNWFGTSLYGGFRCWEGSACYNNMISQKPTSSSGSGGFGGIANGISSCDNLVGF